MIEAKIDGRKVVETPEQKVAPVIDIMEALKRSLAEKRKPAQTATAAASASAVGQDEDEAVAEAPAPKKRARRSKAG
jgi:non-homologous end joining protein Ku